MEKDNPLNYCACENRAYFQKDEEKFLKEIDKCIDKYEPDRRYPPNFECSKLIGDCRSCFHLCLLEEEYRGICQKHCIEYYGLENCSSLIDKLKIEK